MKRRKFIEAGLVATLVGLLPITLRGKQPELWSFIAESLANRRNGKPSNFSDVHRCYDCGADFYCPDRWLTERCEVKAYLEKQGWNTNVETCLPCKFIGDQDATVAANMTAWREAHLV